MTPQIRIRKETWKWGLREILILIMVMLMEMDEQILPIVIMLIVIILPMLTDEEIPRLIIIEEI